MGEVKKLEPSGWWERQNSWYTTLDVDTYCRQMDTLMSRIDGVVAGSEIAGTGYTTQGEKVSELTDQMGIFYGYISDLPYDIDEIIETPLYEDFNLGATENLSRVSLEDFSTANTLNLKEDVVSYAGGYEYKYTRKKSELTIDDFLGGNNQTVIGSEICTEEYVEGFAKLFAEDYNNSVGNVEEQVSLDEYLESIKTLGEFDHKMDKPFENFLSGLLDLTIIKPLIETFTGEDLITGEDLSDFECGMKFVGAIVDAIAIGTALFTGGGSLAVAQMLKRAPRILLSELVTDASAYTIGYVSDQLGLPPAVSWLLALGGGSLVAKNMGEWAVKGLDGQEYILKADEGSAKTLKVDELVTRDSKFLNEEGKIDWEKWAPNGGRVPGTIKEGQTLPIGTIIDRYGNKYGKYTSPVGVPYEKRALPYIENPNAYHKYEVVKPIDNVTISEIAAAFEQPGGGIQYELPNNIKKLLKDGYIKEID